MKFVPAAAKAEGVPARTQLQALNDIILYHNTAQLVSMDQRKFQVYCEEMQKKTVNFHGCTPQTNGGRYHVIQEQAESCRIVITLCVNHSEKCVQNVTQ